MIGFLRFLRDKVAYIYFIGHKHDITAIANTRHSYKARNTAGETDICPEYME